MKMYFLAKCDLWSHFKRETLFQRVDEWMGSEEVITVLLGSDFAMSGFSFCPWHVSPGWVLPLPKAKAEKHRLLLGSCSVLGPALSFA